MTKIRTAICVEAGDVELSVRELLAREGEYEVVACVDSAPRLVETCETFCPDLVVLDQHLADEATQDQLVTPGLGAPIPVLLLVDVEGRLSPAQRGRDRRARLSRVARSLVLRSDDVALAHVRTRLALVAARLGRSHAKRTQSADAVADARAELRRRAAGARMRDAVVRLTAAPLDSITVVAGRGRLPRVLELVARLTALPVPVLIVLDEPDGGAADTIAAIAQFKVARLEATLPLRAAHGLLCASAGRSVVVAEDLLRVGDAPAASGPQVASMASLGSGGLTVLMGADRPEMSASANEIYAAGGHVATAERSAQEESAAGGASGLDCTDMNVDELAWLISRAVPRRA